MVALSILSRRASFCSMVVNFEDHSISVRVGIASSVALSVDEKPPSTVI